MLLIHSSGDVTEFSVVSLLSKVALEKKETIVETHEEYGEVK